jgi:hypothetical protein
MRRRVSERGSGREERERAWHLSYVLTCSTRMEFASACRCSALHSVGGAYDSWPAPENSFAAPAAGVVLHVGTCGGWVEDERVGAREGG